MTILGVWVFGVATGVPAGVALTRAWRRYTAPPPSLLDPDRQRREMTRRNPYMAG